MRKLTATLAAVSALALGSTALSAEEKHDYGDWNYNSSVFYEQSASIPWHILAVYGGTFAVGVGDWDWGSSSFKTHSEGFFGKDTANGGMDKLGHAWSAALLTDLFTNAIRDRTDNPMGAEYTGFLLSMGVMTTIEVFDGFSKGYGFSYEDIIADTAGAAFGLLRVSVPGLRDKLDFRMEYLPSGNVDGFRPHSDYSGQKYVFALKLSGFEAFEDTPLRFVELQAGYFARGFTEEEQHNGDDKRREPYVAVGVNLQELLFGYEKVRHTDVGRWGRTVLEYVQVPYTYVPTKRD